MKRILMLVILVMVMGCSPNGNQGYGYGTSKEKGFLERAAEEQNAKTMKLYDTTGKLRSYCKAYKGEFDGHTWYVFYDNLASPAVVHDPNCKCQERWK